MNINSKYIKELIDVAVTLDDEFQKKSLAKMYELQLEQKAKRKIEKKNLAEGKKMAEVTLRDEIRTETNNLAKEILDMADMLDKMDSSQKAAMAMMMEKLSPGAFTKEEEISIVINSKTISLKDYLEKMLPDVNYNDAKSLFEEFKSTES